LISLQVGLHIAGEALHKRRNNMPPHAITLSPYIVTRKPIGVVKNFQNATKKILVLSPQVCFGGNWYPLSKGDTLALELVLFVGISDIELIGPESSTSGTL
jgi:hypothetical protein